MKRLGGWWRLWFAISGLWVVLAVGIGITIIVGVQSAADRMKVSIEFACPQPKPTIPPPPPGYVLQSLEGPVQTLGPTKPTYKVTAPDGSVYDVTTPEGATQEQALAYAQAHYQEAKKPTLGQIGEALKRADAAGNTEDARRLAQAYEQMRNATPRARTMKLSELNDLDRCNRAKHRDYASEVFKSRADTVIGTVVGAASLPLILLILGLLTGWVARGFHSNNPKKQAKP